MCSLRVKLWSPFTLLSETQCWQKHRRSPFQLFNGSQPTNLPTTNSSQHCLLAIIECQREGMNGRIFSAQVLQSKGITFNRTYLYPLSGGLGPENATNCCPIKPSCYIALSPCWGRCVSPPSSLTETSYMRVRQQTSPVGFNVLPSCGWGTAVIGQKGWVRGGKWKKESLHDCMAKLLRGDEGAWAWMIGRK